MSHALRLSIACRHLGLHCVTLILPAAAVPLNSLHFGRHHHWPAANDSADRGPEAA